jgi:hypothetical protein
MTLTTGALAAPQDESEFNHALGSTANLQTPTINFIRAKADKLHPNTHHRGLINGNVEQPRQHGPQLGLRRPVRGETAAASAHLEEHIRPYRSMQQPVSQLLKLSFDEATLQYYTYRLGRFLVGSRRLA